MTTAELRDFAQALATRNPFRDNRVSKPADAYADVGTIHDLEFRRILRAIGDVQGGKQARGLTLVGPAGVGKSHLLGRLHTWATQQQTVDYVFLHNLQASPERTPRYLLKAVVHGLFAYRRGTYGYGTAHLYTLLLNALPADAADTPAAQLVRRMSEDDHPVELAIYGVLIAFMKALGVSEENPVQRKLTDAAFEWLSGETIDDEVADDLGALCGRSIPTELMDNLEIERALCVFADLLASAGKSLVVCLDQIDNLDEGQVRALVAFLHALIDHGSNLLVICSGVESSLEKMREEGTIPEAAWDRIADERVALNEIKVHEARDIIIGRLDNFCKPFLEVREVAAQRVKDPLFPLGEPWWRQCMGNALQIRPRDVVSQARHVWSRQQDALHEFGVDGWIERWTDSALEQGEDQPENREQLVDTCVQTKLNVLIDEREREPASLPADSDNMATLARCLLSECTGHDGYSLVSITPAPEPTRGHVKHFDLSAVERTPQDLQVETRILFVTTRHGNSVTAALRRLNDECTDSQNVLLVTDERRPLRLGPRGQEHFDSLQARGPECFQHLKLTFRAYSELDALVSLLRQARVGDFEVTVGATQSPVSESEVAACYHRLDLLRSHPLLQHLLTEPDRNCDGPAVLNAELLRTGICGLLSWRTGVRAKELAAQLGEDHGVPNDAVLLGQVIDMSERLHREGLIDATEDAEDRYLWWLGSAS